MTCDYQKTGTNAGYNVIVPAGCLGDTQINLQCKAPSESVYYHFSLVNRLQLSETIMSVIAEPSDGTEVIVDNITISNRNFKCRISGGNLNTYAGIRFLVTTNTNSVREFDVTLPVLPAGVIKDGETGKSYVIGDKGGKGDDGITPSIKAGTTTTLDAGEQASVSATTKGTETTFDFFIPQGHQGETGAKGIDGIDGIDGKDGTQVLTSNVDPLAKDASENLLWLNIVTGDLFETSPVGNGQYSWNKLGNLKGKAGSMIYTGTVDPVYNSIYKNSDLYFNIKNYNLFSFSDAQWILIGNLKGEQGARGSLWYFGTEDPIASSHYKELDSYLNTKSYNLFVYNGNAWQKTGNIKGEQGVQGIQGLQGEQGLAGKDGAQGEQGVAGKDGATWYNAPANPTSSIHYKEFDSFLNTETYDLFIYNGSNWQHTGNLKGEQGVQGISGVQGEQGIAGKDGAQGEQGLAGKDGATWYNAPSDPTPSTHYKEFDNFLNTETYDVFIYNGSNWQNKGNIKGEQGVQGPQGIPGETGPIGPQGEQGLAGKDGATWYYAPSDPTSSIHYKEFDHFLNTETYDLFVYNGSNWQNKGNIKGEQGLQGPQGIPGETGPVGPQGEQGLPGLDGKDGSRITTSDSDPDPSTATLNPYNIWLNTKTWDMWRTIENNTGHEWIKIGNTQGKQGEQGIQGEVGQDGKDGKDGVTPTIVAGNTSTLNPGDAAKVIATTTGTTTVFDFSVPQGPKGDAGSRWYSGMKNPDDTVGASDTRGLPRAGDMYLHLDAEDHEAETYIFTEDKTWAGPLATVAGPPGKDALQPTFKLGDVQTVSSDEKATVDMQTDVTTAQTTISYKIPKGEQGDQGEKGDKGDSYINDGTVDLNVKSLTIYDDDKKSIVSLSKDEVNISASKTTIDPLRTTDFRILKENAYSDDDAILKINYDDTYDDQGNLTEDKKTTLNLSGANYVQLNNLNFNYLQGKGVESYTIQIDYRYWVDGIEVGGIFNSNVSKNAKGYYFSPNGFGSSDNPVFNYDDPNNAGFQPYYIGTSLKAGRSAYLTTDNRGLYGIPTIAIKYDDSNNSYKVYTYQDGTCFGYGAFYFRTNPISKEKLLAKTINNDDFGVGGAMGTVFCVDSWYSDVDQFPTYVQKVTYNTDSLSEADFVPLTPNYKLGMTNFLQDDVPASMTSPGKKGATTFDENYMYHCIADNQWVRFAKDNTDW